MADVAANLYECPACTKLYDCPKLLACYHILCRKCVISSLQKTGGRGKCPICHAPILSSSPQDEGQLEAQVDGLPTDMATQSLADSHRILSDPDECQICPVNVPGHNFCLQCSVKLCTSCTLHHQKLPGTSHHKLEKLRKLTLKRLAARHQVKCKTHTHQVVEMYCPSHGELICCRCGLTTHRVCAEIKEIEDAAKEERRKFKDRLERMNVKKTKVAKQVNDAKEQFKGMRKMAKDVFDDLSEIVKKRRRDVDNLIQAEEDSMMESLAEVEIAQVSVDLPLRNIENLVLESPDDGLLEMLQQLASRLDNLESRMEVKDDVRNVGCLVFDDQIITRLKSDLGKLGWMQQLQDQPTSTPAAGVIPRTNATASGQTQQLQRQPTSRPAAGVTATTSATASGQTLRPQSQPTSTLAARVTTAASAAASGPTTAVKPQGAELARVLKVGDRVKMAPDRINNYTLVQPGHTGTVTAIPSRIQAERGADPQGLVDVRWDSAGARCHRMGWKDEYELILA